MGLLCAVVMMLAILVITWTVSRWDAKTAYRLFEHSSQHFFEPESDTGDVASPVVPVTVQTHSPGNRGRLSPGKRPYISPHREETGRSEAEVALRYLQTTFG